MKKPAKGKAMPVASASEASGQPESEQIAAAVPAKARTEKRSKAKSGASAVPCLVAAAPTKTRIEYLNLTAREVFVAGTFNQWDPLATALKPHAEGKWEVDLALEPGRYEYRFVVDGQWTEDPKSSEYTANPYGGLNSVLQVAMRT